MGSSCEQDVRAEPYAPWIEVESVNGMFRVILDDAVPAPPGRGDNAWTLMLRDANGAFMVPDSFRVRAWMPDHGHGTHPEWNDAAAISGTRHLVGPFDLFMKGLWEFTFEVTKDGATDTAKLAFCVNTDSTGVPTDGGVDPERDSGVEPIECNVVAPTACTDPNLKYADVQPIIQTHCVSCHDGTQDQWPLTSYSHVADWYDDIRSRLLTCGMPPPDSEVTMTTDERETILHWIRCGYPRD